MTGNKMLEGRGIKIHIEHTNAGPAQEKLVKKRQGMRFECIQ